MKNNKVSQYIKCLLVGLFSFMGVAVAFTQQTYLKEINGIPRLIVKGEPFIMLSGEVHNSTSSTYEYLSTTWASLKAMHLNSVVVPVSWEQLEPHEGVFDYTMIQHIIDLAEKHQMQVAIAWFGTWKNGESSYTPLWVKTDTKRFFRVRDKNGKATSTISPFCQNACEADCKAFEALMRYIKENDTNGMISVIQVENEVGCFQDIDYCKESQEAYKQEVPVALINYLIENENNIHPMLMQDWVANGKKKQGSWSEVFGSTSDSRHYFMTWYYASYIQKVAHTGKVIHALPMFVNAALSGSDDALPGSFPNGGPVSKVIDIYKVAAPDIDWCSPDIYSPNFREICAQYHRKGNPLFIPESYRSAASAFYAFAAHDALCYSPFAIEDAYLDKSFKKTYAVLRELLPLISSYQGTGKMSGFLRQGGETGTSLQLGNYNIDVKYVKEEKDAFGLIIQVSPDEFIVAGLGAHIRINSLVENVSTQYADVLEGHFDGLDWTTDCRLNGDQTGHHSSLYLRGRSNFSDKEFPQKDEIFPLPNPAVWEANKPEVLERIKAPGVYKVKVYTYPQ